MCIRDSYEYLEDGSLKTKIESARPAGAPWETGIKPMEKSSKTDIIGKTNSATLKNKSYKFHFGQPFGVALFVLHHSKSFSTFATLGM